jgi:hypothetical protein
MQNDSVLSDLDHSDEHIDVFLSEVNLMDRQFYSASARGGAVLFLSAALMFLLGILLLAVRADLASSQAWVLWFLLTAVAAFVGLKKLAAPVVLVEATAEGLTYHHPRGSWRLPWQQIAHVQQIELQGRELAWIGVRLHSYDQLLETIPLRLAVRLLIEQRAVLIAAAGGACPTGRCAGDYLADATEFRTSQRQYKGVQAMFGQRMANLRQLLNTDLLIPADLKDCPAQEFSQFINRQRLIFTQENNG